MVEFTPVSTGTVLIVFTCILAGIIIASRDVLFGTAFVKRIRPFAHKARLSDILFRMLLVGRPFVRHLLGKLVVFDTCIELLSLLPGLLELRLPLCFEVLQLLAQVLVMILAFLDNFVEMILFVFARFIHFVFDFVFLTIGPVDKLLLE